MILLFSSAVMLAFMYEIMRLSSEHAQNSYTRGEGRLGSRELMLNGASEETH